MKNKPNYKLKSIVMNLGLCEEERRISRELFIIHQKEIIFNDKGLEINLTDDVNKLCQQRQNLIDVYGEEYMKESHKINKASYDRRERLSSRIESMLKSNQCIFLTLTFRDDVLLSTSEETRRKYITRFLKQCSTKYVANVDYGGKNGREHYHAVVMCNQVDHKLWTYGNLDFKRIRSADDNVKLAKYVVKLTNHAIKETTKRNHTIYSKQI